jgi:hypothetical protein
MAPHYGDLAIDSGGRMYGTTPSGGIDGRGIVYELTQSGGSWTENIIYSFETSGPVGAAPYSGLILDQAGNLYGTASAAGEGYGTVYELTKSGSNWTANALYEFIGQSDGGTPMGGLVFDSRGDLFGTTCFDGNEYGGTAFELSSTGGSWTFNLLYSFNDWPGPLDSLTMDAAGNLYGTSNSGGAYGQGSVFKLTYSEGVWNYTTLHDFTGGSDGGNPIGNVILDASGNIYGTASSSGAYSDGTVWEVTP